MTPKKIPTVETDGQTVPRDLWLDARNAVRTALSQLEISGWDVTDVAVLSALVSAIVESDFVCGLEAGKEGQR